MIVYKTRFLLTNMEKKMKTILMITYIFALFLSTNLYANFESVFHEAETEAEIRLNHILTLCMNDNNMFHCIIGTPDCDKNKDTYDELFTQDLRTAFSTDLSGFDICPILCDDYFQIICGQDAPQRFLFRTLEQNEEMAIIEYSWSVGKFKSQYPQYPKYKLIKQGDTWVLDGIHRSWENGTSCSHNFKLDT